MLTDPGQVTRAMTHCECEGMGFVRANVPTSHPLFGEAIMCVCRVSKVARERAERLREQSGLDDAVLHRFRLEAFDVKACGVPAGADPEKLREVMRDVVRECVEYAADPRGWIVLVGPYGSGKTHLAYGIAGACLRADLPVFAGASPDILGGLRSRYDVGDFEAVFEMLRSVDLFVIDDLATESATAWTTEKLYQITNWRYQNALPMVVTSNLHPSKMGSKLDGRIVSRLVDVDFSKVLVLPATDYRQRRGG